MRSTEGVLSFVAGIAAGMMPDETLLQAASEHVAYEFWRLFEAERLWPITPEGQGKRLLIEAHLLHLRNVIDFLYYMGKTNDDITAADFIVNPIEWTVTMPAWVPEYKARCNKLLSHLTYSRVRHQSEKNMYWQLEQPLQDIKDAWQEFLSCVPPERRAWFQRTF